MNDIVTHSATMTSREIAELVESRHDSVKLCVERLVAKGVISRPPMVDGNKAANGIIESVYQIAKRDSYVIVAQLSPEFTARLVDRWQELEAKAAPVLTTPPNFAAALRLAADQAEEIATQREQLQLAAPAIAFVEKFVDSTGLKGFRQVCKLLNANEAEFRTFLEDKKIMYRLGGEWTPHAQHMDTGRFSVKAGTSEVSGHAFNSARFTAKGVNWVAGEWAKYKLEAQTEVAA